MNWKSVLFGAAAVIAIAAAFLIGRSCDRNAIESAETVRTDTLFIYDTITQSEPKERTIRVLDTILVQAIDTVTVRDTLYVYMEREQVMWRDSLCEVYASGVLPEVDSVRHFTRERVIVRDRMLPRSHWGIGVSAGPAVGYFITPAGWQPGAGVSVQVGIVYKF